MTIGSDFETIKDYVDAGGVRTYYEVYGAGDPLVMLHGGFCTVDTWSEQVPALADQYRTYLPERRGQGRTPDIDGPITYENQADDTIAFMDALGLSSAHLIGWSDGGNVGLIVAMKRPDLVRKLVFMSAAANHDGYVPEFKEMEKTLTLEGFPPMLVDAYKAVSPDGPDHAAVVFAKIKELWHTEPTHDLDELGQVQAPTLVMLGDNDVVAVDHAAAVAAAIPNSQLAVVPGTDHLLIFEKPEVVNRLLLDFLSDEQPAKQMVERHTDVFEKPD